MGRKIRTGLFIIIGMMVLFFGIRMISNGNNLSQIIIIPMLGFILALVVYAVTKPFIKQPPSNTSSSLTKQRKIYLLLVVIATGFMLYVGKPWESGFSLGGASSNGNDAAAYVACKHFVEQQLKSPSTADFPFMPPYEPKISGNNYTIFGYVDAQNSFGATGRVEWTCNVVYDPDNAASFNRFRLVSVDLKE